MLLVFAKDVCRLPCSSWECCLLNIFLENKITKETHSSFLLIKYFGIGYHVVGFQLLSRVRLSVTLGLQHATLPCPSLSPRVCSNSCPLGRLSYLTISSSATPFSFCFHSFPASGSFPMSQFFASGGQTIGASASVSSFQ